MTKPKPSFSPRWISTSYGCREAGATALPPPPPPPLPMPLVEPLPELTVLREFWLPWGVRLPSVRLGAWVLLWWEEAGDGGTNDHVGPPWPPAAAQRLAVGLTGVAGGLAPHGEVDVALLGRLLHQLHHQLVRLAHHRRAVHAGQLVARAQAAVLVRRAILHDVADVDLEEERRRHAEGNTETHAPPVRSPRVQQLHLGRTHRRKSKRKHTEREDHSFTSFTDWSRQNAQIATSTGRWRRSQTHRLAGLVSSQDPEAEARVLPPEEDVLVLAGEGAGVRGVLLVGEARQGLRGGVARHGGGWRRVAGGVGVGGATMAAHAELGAALAVLPLQLLLWDHERVRDGPESPQGHHKVPKRSLQGHHKVTKRSPKGLYKVTTRSPKGLHKVTKRSLQGHHKHGDLAAPGALAEQVHHLVVAHVLHVPLVDLHQDVGLPQAAAARVIHDLLDALAAARQAVGDGEAEALVALLHVDGDELGLRGDGRRHVHHVAGVAAGRRLGRPRRAARPRAAGAAIERAGLAAGRVEGLLPVDDDGLLVHDGHRGHQAGVGVVGVEGQRVAAAQRQVHHGADGDGLEDLHHLGVGVAQNHGVVHAHDNVACGEHRERRRI
ncbi:hypothetical protein EYF80_051463 [Liparis tanakae]|uniref:Uncharacterized protein n=1 Tax=Liparis tanakae TaxID=230148 RepID=A0A4Z2FB17_9TELE|nr:hypothetical protein EYF80_051463 [Liparis tanakae]